jgi:hydrogenase/urease accessory protein HupE
MTALRFVLAATLFRALAAASSVVAHPLDPALLEVRESSTGTVDVLWRLSASQAAGDPLKVVLPVECVSLSAPELNRSGARVTVRWSAQCGDGSLVGRQIGVAGLRERGTDAVLRAHLADGRLVQAVLRGDAPTLTIPAQSGRFDVLRDYLRLGFEHILSGPDHLLFVLGLVLLVRGWRRLFWTITAFTAGHSITLSLAVLGVVDISSQPVEVLIAVSIVVVAVELVRGGRESWIQRFPWSIAIAFGLLHGLGFAGALTEVGLPADEVPLALFAFNVGIELGQLLCVALILAVMAGLRAAPVSWPTALQRIPAYTIGSLGVFWVSERMISML